MPCCYYSTTEGEPELTSTREPSSLHPYPSFCTFTLSLYEYESEVTFRGSTPSADLYLCSTFWGSTQSLLLVPYMSHLRWRGVNSMSGSTSVQVEVISGVNSISSSTSVQPELIVQGRGSTLSQDPSPDSYLWFYLSRVHSISSSIHVSS